MEKSEKIDLLAKALISFQKKVEPVVKNCVNPYFNSKYNDLGHLITECSKLAADCGLAVCQLPSKDGLSTMLVHESGQFIAATHPIILNKQGPHELGSAITYLRRYAYKAVLGIPEVDDDGNLAQNKEKITKERIDTMIEKFNELGVTKKTLEKMCGNKNIYEISEKSFAQLGKYYSTVLSQKNVPRETN